MTRKHQEIKCQNDNEHGQSIDDNSGRIHEEEGEDDTDEPSLLRGVRNSQNGQEEAVQEVDDVENLEKAVNKLENNQKA